MNLLRSVWRELIGLFVDDGWLAFGIVLVVAAAAVSASLFPDAPLAAGAVLLFGCLGVLIANVGHGNASPQTKPRAGS